MRFAVAFVVLLCSQQRAFAGDIFGIINQGGRPIPGARVDVTISNKTYFTNTDSRGSYRLNVAERGKGKLIGLC